jgi:hypothetical protein
MGNYNVTTSNISSLHRTEPGKKSEIYTRLMISTALPRETLGFLICFNIHSRKYNIKIIENTWE